jgi:3-methyladenine DNA glycosylase Tag
MLIRIGYAVAIANDLDRDEESGFRFVGPTIGYARVQAVGIVNDHHVRCFRRSALSSANYTDG